MQPHAVSHSCGQYAAYSAYVPPIPDTPVFVAVVPEETPECDEEVQDECMLQIMSVKMSCPEVKQGIVNGFTCGTRDPQLQKANTLLKKVGKTIDERIDGLGDFKENL
jgi:hypothetical protein